MTNEEAISEGHMAVAVRSNHPHALGVLGHVYAAAGRPQEARRVLADLQRPPANGHVPAFDMAIVHAGLGEKAEALRHLEASLAEREDMIYFLKVDPVLDSLRSEPRFADLLRRGGFAQ